MQAPDQPHDIPPAIGQPDVTPPPEPSRPARRRVGSGLGIALVLVGLALIALALRLNGVRWDQGHLFHPDERAILMKVGDISFPWPPDPALLLDAEHSPWNPHWFPYGSLVLYLLKLAAGVAGLVLGRSGFEDMAVVGRVVAALLDTWTVLLLYALGARLYGRATGLLAAGFAALAVIHIQMSHFYTSDPLLTFFLTGSMLFLAGLARTGRLRDAALAGLLFGLALATKVSAAPFLLAAGVAALASCFDGDSLHVASFRRERVGRAIGALAVFMGVVAVAFAVAAPYEMLDFRTFWGDVTREGEMARRIADFPYTRQYINTTPYLYHVQQLATWGLGWPLGLVAWGGLAVALLMAALRRRKADVLLLMWVVPYFAVVGAFDVKFLRYMLPITPFLLLFGARALVGFHRVAQVAREAADAFGGWTRRALAAAPRVAAGVVIVILAATTLYAAAFSAIYTRPHPAVEASRWIRANVPAGAVVAKEHWEEGIPDLGDYRNIELGLYEPDNATKRDILARQLAEADLVVFYSNRLYGTIPRLPDRYPMSSRYYQLLFDGDLGFELAYTAVSYPTLAGVSLVDDTFTRPGLTPPAPLRDYQPSPVSINMGYADESFTVYDHPKVMVFRNVRRMDAGAIAATLGEPPTVEPPRLGLVFTPAEWQVYRESGTWSALFDRLSPMNRAPEMTWLLAVELMALLAFPLTFKVCGRLPDRGYVLAKSVGILLVAYLTWLAASTWTLPFTRGTILLAMGLLGLVSAGVAWRWRAELRAWLTENRSIVLAGEAVFLVAFVGFYVIRILNPDLWHAWRGGEKPMDFAYLNAVIRSEYMPPYDPWFAGGYLNYYYFGQFITATIIKLTGIIPSVAYNLAVPLFYALTASAAFSIVYNLAAAFQRNAKPETARRLPSPLLAGVAGAVLVAGIGNLDGGIQVAQGAWRAVTDNIPFPPFDFWRSSRMMPPTISITEFPFWSFLFADLHAHLMGMPFYLLVIGLALNMALGCKRGLGLASETASLLLAALAIGALRVINSWDYPTFVLMAGAGAAIGEVSARQRMDLAAVSWVVLKLAILAVLSMLFFLPFHQKFAVFYNGVLPSVGETPLLQYLSIHGLFVFLVISYVAFELWRVARLSGRESEQDPAGVGAALADQGGAAVAASPDGGQTVLVARAGIGYFWPAYTGVIGAVVLALYLLRYETIAFLFLLLSAVAALAQVMPARPRDEGMAPRLFVLALIALALGLGIGVDMVTVQGDIERMNTVFKFYLQAWVLLGLASAFVVWRLGAGMAPLAGRPLGLPRVAWMTPFALLLAASLAFPILGTPARIADRFVALPPTNDGMAYMRYAVHREEDREMELRWDYEAIRWLQDNVRGSPVILEGNTDLYHWGNRVSVYTGLPDVVGWDWHQRQQRVAYDGAVNARRADVKEMYSTLNQVRALEMLRRYQVEYVYVGPLERVYYPAAGLGKFQRMVGASLDVAFSSPEVTIYRVRAAS